MIGLKKSIENNTRNKRKKQFISTNNVVTWERTVFGVGAKRRIKLRLDAKGLIR